MRVQVCVFACATVHVCVCISISLHVCVCVSISLHVLQALLAEYRAHSVDSKALLTEYRALLTEYRALLTEYRALLPCILHKSACVQVCKCACLHVRAHVCVSVQCVHACVCVCVCDLQGFATRQPERPHCCARSFLRDGSVDRLYTFQHLLRFFFFCQHYSLISHEMNHEYICIYIYIHIFML